MMHRFVLLAIAATALYGQEPAFDVASIKPTGTNPVQVSGATFSVQLPQVSGGPGTATPDQITYRNVSVSYLILRAFDIRSNQAVIPPGLTATFDIVANVPAGATPAQVPLMLQALLRDRFGLKFHKESQTRQVYFVRVGKNGVKFKESPPLEPAPPGGPARPDPTAVDDEGYPKLPPDYVGLNMRGGSGRMMLVAQRQKLSSLLQFLESQLGRQLVDETGLTGTYDIRLTFAMGNPAPGAVIPADPVPTAREAVENLGLNLQAGEAPIEVLVVDAIEKEPTEN